jgi:hypothetical protein
MKRFLAPLAAVLTFSSALASATTPSHLITHNLTDVESNAFVAGTIPSPYPTKAHSEGSVAWWQVRFACYNNTTPAGLCPALIKMATDTANPIELGYVYLDLKTGDITPQTLSAHGYTATVNKPGEVTITQE